MNTWLGHFSTASLLPSLAMQQLFHTFVWLAVLSWLGVQCLPSYDRRWRWVMCSIAALLVLLVWQSVLPSLGLVFQTPSLMTLCACLAVAWDDIRPIQPTVWQPRYIAPRPGVVVGAGVGRLVLVARCIWLAAMGHLQHGL